MKMDIANFYQRNQMIDRVDKVQKSKQKFLSLEDFDLTEFPSIILNCHSLRNLMLQRNQISELPKEVGIHLRGLKYLSIQFNNIGSFPECLKHLTALVSLNISHNPIMCLPEDISCFKDLRYLWCNSCGIMCLPRALGLLSKLETFGARNNRIITLPESITNLKDIRWMSLEGNCIDSLPNDFYKLKKLHHLNLNKNCFTIIPEEISKMMALMYLHLQGNNISRLSRDVIESVSYVKISLMNNPLENGHEFTEFKHLMLNPTDYKLEHNNLQDQVRDSSESDSDWKNSTDTLYLNYNSSAENSEFDDAVEIVVKVPKLTRLFVGQ